MQPERTDLAWRRTSLALVVAAAVFLRWLPHYGWFVGTLIAASIGSALSTNVTREARYYRAVHGINREHMPPDITSAGVVAASVVVLASLGIYTVIFLPLHV